MMMMCAIIDIWEVNDVIIITEDIASFKRCAMFWDEQRRNDEPHFLETWEFTKLI